MMKYCSQHEAESAIPEIDPVQRDDTKREQPAGSSGEEAVKIQIDRRDGKKQAERNQPEPGIEKAGQNRKHRQPAQRHAQPL